MMRTLCIILLATMAFPAASSRSNTGEFVLSRYQFVAPNKMALDAIASQFEIESRDQDVFTVLVPRHYARKFLALAPKAVLIAADSEAEIKQMEATDSDVLAAYRRYDEVVQHLRDLSTSYPEIVSLESFGESTQGRDQWVLKVSDRVNEDEEGEAKVLLTAATHGDELITVETMLALIDKLVKGYGVDERLSAMVNTTALYFVPMVNVDGFAQRTRYDNGVDPNREYPWPEQVERQPVRSIQNIMDFAQRHKFQGSLDFHASGKLVMYPWAYTTEPVATPRNARVMDDLTTRMAVENHYQHGPISTTIYIAKGSSCDYYYWKFGTIAIAVELAYSKVPSNIPAVVEEAREMTWKFIEHFAAQGG